MSSFLSNHLRANRKRLDLSQNEVAILLGGHSGAKVCRFERFVRKPTLEMALAFEVIFQKPVATLFPGLYKSVRRKVEARAKALGYRVQYRKSDKRTIRKRNALRSIVEPLSIKS